MLFFIVFGVFYNLSHDNLVCKPKYFGIINKLKNLVEIFVGCNQALHKGATFSCLSVKSGITEKYLIAIFCAKANNASHFIVVCVYFLAILLFIIIYVAKHYVHFYAHTITLCIHNMNV